MPNCRNCGESITLVNYSLGPTWMHNPPGYTGHKMVGGAYNVFRHCRTAVAQPPLDPATALDAATDAYRDSLT